MGIIPTVPIVTGAAVRLTRDLRLRSRSRPGDIVRTSACAVPWLRSTMIWNNSGLGSASWYSCGSGMKWRRWGSYRTPVNA